MKFDGPDVDEYGTLRFTVVAKSGAMYLFEREEKSQFLFVTVMDEEGSATEKRIIDVTKTENRDIVDMYNDYLKERTDGQ